MSNTVLNVTCYIDALEFAQELVGKKGPIYVNIAVDAHHIGRRGQFQQNDLEKIGEENKNITFTDLITFFNKVNHRAQNVNINKASTFTFIFDGIKGVPTNNSSNDSPIISYRLCWGT